MNEAFSNGGTAAEDGSDIVQGSLDEDGVFYPSEGGEVFARWNDLDGWHVLTPYQARMCGFIV